MPITASEYRRQIHALLDRRIDDVEFKAEATEIFAAYLDGLSPDEIDRVSKNMQQILLRRDERRRTREADDSSAACGAM